MSNVTIRFWSTQFGRYVENDSDYVTGNGMDNCWVWNDLLGEYVYDENVTPHFYKDGERIV